MTDVLVHRVEGVLEPFRYPTLLEKIELEHEDAILSLYERTLNRVPQEYRSEYERTLLLFYRRAKKHNVEIWKLPWLGRNAIYWRGIVVQRYPNGPRPDMDYLRTWYCRANGGSWKTDTGYPRRRRREGDLF